MINKSNLNQILSFFPEEQHDLLKKQISNMTKIIESNEMKYTYSLDFRSAIDIIIENILKGEFLDI